jgi:hypothetical protein
MKDEKKHALTLQDLQDAVEVINEFAKLYRKAQLSVKNLAKEQGKYGGMMGRGTDPITALLFGSMEGVVQRKIEELADKKVRALTGGESVEEEVDESDLEEAKEGLEQE